MVGNCGVCLSQQSIYIATKLSLFKVNYVRKSKMGFEIRKKGKHVKAEKFVKKMKEIYEEVKAVLKIKKYVDKNRKMVVEYKVGDRVLLSTKNLTWQMRNRKTKKLKKFIGPYKIKKIILENVVELDLSVLMKIHPVVNMSRITMYQKQVERQKKIPPSLVEIDREKKYEVEKC